MWVSQGKGVRMGVRPSWGQGKAGAGDGGQGSCLLPVGGAAEGEEAWGTYHGVVTA